MEPPEVKVVTWPETEVYPGQVAKATHTYGTGSLANTHVSLQRRQKPTVCKLGRRQLCFKCKGETSIWVSVISRKRKLNKGFNVKVYCDQLCSSIRMTS